MRAAGQVIITLILLWAHLQSDEQPSMVRTSGYTGVEPITPQTLPLSADDVIRGLRAHPTITFDTNTLEKSYTLRQEFARKKSARDALEYKLGEQTILVITAMEMEKQP